MYEKIFKLFNTFFETTIKHRNMIEYRSFLEQSQWWTPEQLRQHQWESVQRLLNHAFANVPYWQDTFKRLRLSVSDFKTLDDIRKLPIIDKTDIRSNKNQMIAINWYGKTWTKSTGGSTGMPLELDYTPESYDWRVACSKRGYSWANGCEDGERQAYIWGVGIGKQSLLKRLKELLHHLLLRQKYFNCFEFNIKQMALCLASLNSFKPEYIVGYTNPLYELSRFIQKTGKLSFTPRAVISAAEKLHPFQRETIQSAFQCPAFNTYGSREFMLIASECDKYEGLHVSMENLLVEIIKEDGTPAKQGETGDLVITDLHNYGMPFIRYRIGDMAVCSDKQCSCKRGLMMLADVVGRSLDIIRTPDGRKVPGEFFPHLMKEFKGVEKFQVIQGKLDHLEVRIIKNSKFSEAESQFMQNEIFKTMGQGIKIDYVFVDDIPLTKTGKFRVTISKLTDENHPNC